MKKIKLKIGDIYHFGYKPEVIDDIEKKWYRGHTTHCFEGLLVVMKSHKWNDDKRKYDEVVMLVDTFWGINREDNNKRFTLEEALKLGNLEYYCNLDEIEKIEKYDLDKYDNKDLFRLHDQHSCSEYWYKKIGAVKSPVKRISVIDKEINKAKSEIEYRVRTIESLSAERKKLEINGFDN